ERACILAIVHTETADIRTRAASTQRLRPYPRTLQRLPHQLQQQPLLRVHLERLPRRNAKEPGVEFLHRVEKTSFLRQAPRGEFHLAQPSPPARRQRTHALAPALQERPIALWARHIPRRSAAHPHDRDGLRGDALCDFQSPFQLLNLEKTSAKCEC